ncbi:ABC transporter substrate-binding protein [Psychrobacillus glaciei]|uniref:ABC transporter substrate-binding protein n=1 Tax=Psychrobacillus glaciei TaxID=2283160 RepID=A0A5J6SSJ0_9BACI|nr:ABC transporter substrate-binding protein [Psychrobacillus glaciei]QFG00957.1 ABC transporter substrate-binding protein [Psychrobacillus glaciei]
MKKLSLVIVSALLLVLAACGSLENKAVEKESIKTEESNTKIESKEEVKNTSIEVVDATGQNIKFDAVPESIATLSSGDLDILMALGANVIGRPSASGEVDDSIKDIVEIGNPHQPNFEKIAEIHPTVLVASPSFKQYAANLESQGTKVVYTQANSIEDIQTTISLFGTLLGKQDEAKDLNATISEKATNVATVEGDSIKTLLVYGAPGTYLVALPNSLTGDLLEKAGGENIASDFPAEENYPQYANLSIEKIIERNPQVVMLITHGDPAGVKAAFEEEMAKNAAWKNLDAVKNGNVVVLPSNLFGTNPGTKVIEALEVMKESLASVK